MACTWPIPSWWWCGLNGNDILIVKTRSLITSLLCSMKKEKFRQKINRNGKEKGNVTLNNPVPEYLRPFLHYYHGDFWVTRSFDPAFMAYLMFEGFLPIATKIGQSDEKSEDPANYVLLPKLHEKRCIIMLDNKPTKDFCQASALHISKSIRKKSRKWNLSVNQAFDQVVEGCHQQHGISWLYPPIVNAFKSIHEYTDDAGRRGMPIAGPYPVAHGFRVLLYSIELCDAETGTLDAGELGYSIGGVYTSLTGFSRVSGAGSVQLAALGSLLQAKGYGMWDLGMDMEYKHGMGAIDMERSKFIERLHELRSRPCVLHTLNRQDDSTSNARELIDFMNSTDSKSLQIAAFEGNKTSS